MSEKETQNYRQLFLVVSFLFLFRKEAPDSVSLQLINCSFLQMLTGTSHLLFFAHSIRYFVVSLSLSLSVPPLTSLRPKNWILFFELCSIIKGVGQWERRVRSLKSFALRRDSLSSLFYLCSHEQSFDLLLFHLSLSSRSVSNVIQMVRTMEELSCRWIHFRKRRKVFRLSSYLFSPSLLLFSMWK